MSVERVRIENRLTNTHASYDERDKAFRGMFSAFKKACNEAGVLRQYKQHEHYESNGAKKRRKRHEAELQALKQKLRDSFLEKRRES